MYTLKFPHYHIYIQICDNFTKIWCNNSWDTETRQIHKGVDNFSTIVDKGQVSLNIFILKYQNIKPRDFEPSLF